MEYLILLIIKKLPTIYKNEPFIKNKSTFINIYKYFFKKSPIFLQKQYICSVLIPSENKYKHN